MACCRGPYSMLAIEAVARLRRRVFRAVRLDLGVGIGKPVGSRWRQESNVVHVLRNDFLRIRP